MQTGMVQPSRSSIHCWFSLGSMCARYTASGGAAKCLVITTYRSPSVLSVILLIVFFPFDSLIASLPELHRAFRSFWLKLFATWQDTDRSLPRRVLPAGRAVSC